MSVTAAVQARAGSITQAAFFQGRSDELTANGRRKLRSMIASIPSGADGIVVSVIGVSVSMGTRRQNLRLARVRAESISEFLDDNGVAGRYRVAVYTEFDVEQRSGTKTANPELISLDSPITSSKGKPLTTTSIAFEVSTTS